MERVTVVANDISCDHCIQSIGKAMEALQGARMIEGNPESKQVVIEFDPSVTNLEKIEAAMEEEGYPVAR